MHPKGYIARMCTTFVAFLLVVGGLIAMEGQSLATLKPFPFPLPWENTMFVFSSTTPDCPSICHCLQAASSESFQGGRPGNGQPPLEAIKEESAMREVTFPQHGFSLHLLLH